MEAKRSHILTGGLLIMAAAVLLALLLTTESTTVERTRDLTTIEEIPHVYWKELAGKRVFFGHQSVGRNLIDGIGDVMSEHPAITLKIVESADIDSIDGAFFGHHKVGNNQNPTSKLDNFEEILRSKSNEIVDIAFLKFCYVDVQNYTDTDQLFLSYDQTLERLAEVCPETTFVHFTVPIESLPNDAIGKLKERIKVLIGRPGLLANNSTRQKYNQLLRARYSGKQSIFDIAKFEAVSPEGTVSSRELGTDKVYMMDRRYSDDGGHLNVQGRRQVAEQLLIMLAQIAHDQDSS